MTATATERMTSAVIRPETRALVDEARSKIVALIPALDEAGIAFEAAWEAFDADTDGIGLDDLHTGPLGVAAGVDVLSDLASLVGQLVGFESMRVDPVELDQRMRARFGLAPRPWMASFGPRREVSV